MFKLALFSVALVFLSIISFFLAVPVFCAFCLFFFLCCHCFSFWSIFDFLSMLSRRLWPSKRGVRFANWPGGALIINNILTWTWNDDDWTYCWPPLFNSDSRLFSMLCCELSCCYTLCKNVMCLKNWSLVVVCFHSGPNYLLVSSIRLCRLKMKQEILIIPFILNYLKGMNNFKF